MENCHNEGSRRQSSSLNPWCALWDPGRTKSPWTAAAPCTQRRVSPSLKASSHLFPNRKLFQAGRDAISWRQAGLVGPPHSESRDKHLSARSSLSQFPPAPGLPCVHIEFFWCFFFLSAKAAFGCLGAGRRHSWLHTCTYITGVTSLCALCTSRFLWFAFLRFKLEAAFRMLA